MWVIYVLLSLFPLFHFLFFLFGLMWDKVSSENNIYWIDLKVGLPDGSDGKESAWNAGNLASIPGSRRYPGEGNGNPTPVLLPGESRGQRSLLGYSPWGCKEWYDWTTLFALDHEKHKNILWFNCMKAWSVFYFPVFSWLLNKA